MKTQKVRPVLVESKEINEIGDICLFSYGLNIAGKADIGYPKQQLILISLEDDKIEVGDTVLTLNNYITRVYGKLGLLLECSGDGDYEESVLKKVIATQDQLSPELILQLVGEYNNGGMKDIEIEIINNYYDVNRLSDFKEPKLTNGYITVANKQSILYTEEEVWNLLVAHSIEFFKKDSLTLIDFFNQNKKK